MTRVVVPTSNYYMKRSNSLFIVPMKLCELAVVILAFFVLHACGRSLIGTLPTDHHRPFLFIGIVSAPENYERRMSLRETWLKNIPKYSTDTYPIRYLFYLAQSHNKTVMDLVRDEQDRHGDLAVLSWQDSYYKLSSKVLEMTKRAFRTFHARYLLKTDDDSYVDVERTLALVKTRWSTAIMAKEQRDGLVSGSSKEFADNLYLGNMIHVITIPEVDRYAMGAGYIIGAAIADILFAKDIRLSFTPYEDGSMGLWIQEAVRRGARVDYVHEPKIVHWTNCADRRDYLIIHYVRPKQMRCMWQNIHTNGEKCCPNE